MTATQIAFTFSSIQAKFEQFHKENPRVYELLVYYARAAKSAGRTELGIAAIWERMRWHVYVETKGGEEFKLNNNFRSRYARLIMERESDLAGFFETRELRSE